MAAALRVLRRGMMRNSAPGVAKFQGSFFGGSSFGWVQPEEFFRLLRHSIGRPVSHRDRRPISHVLEAWLRHRLSRLRPGWRELIREKLFARRGEIATRYNLLVGSGLLQLVDNPWLFGFSTAQICGSRSGRIPLQLLLRHQLSPGV
jgi:hypothetical protein